MGSMETTVAHTLDELGRIVIPKEIRAKLGWGGKDTFSFHCTENNTLTLQLADKYQAVNPQQWLFIICDVIPSLTTLFADVHRVDSGRCSVIYFCINENDYSIRITTQYVVMNGVSYMKLIH